MINYIYLGFFSMLACTVSDAYKKRKTTRFSFHDNMKESVATDGHDLGPRRLMIVGV